jgi:hypothetical protein
MPQAQGRSLTHSPAHIDRGSAARVNSDASITLIQGPLLATVLFTRAGLNHIHLLPTYDFGSVPERPEEQANIHVSGEGGVDRRGRTGSC